MSESGTGGRRGRVRPTGGAASVSAAVGGHWMPCCRRSAGPPVVLDPTETADDLVQDITEVLTSMCARLYGRRAAKTHAARAVAVATGEDAG